MLARCSWQAGISSFQTARRSLFRPWKVFRVTLIPPVLLKAIAWIESGWAQASYDPPVQYGQVGPVLSSHDCGYGIMQVTSGMQNVSGVPNSTRR